MDQALRRSTLPGKEIVIMSNVYDIGYPNPETGVTNPPIEQGSTFRLPFNVDNVFASGGVGCLIRGQARRDYEAAGKVDFVAVIIEVIQDAEIGAAVIFTAGVGSGFAGLVAGALVGRAIFHGGLFRGVVIANTATTVTINDRAYTAATPQSCVLVGILRCLLSLTATTTAAMDAGKWVYDCEIEDVDAFVLKPLRGQALVTREATR